MSRWGTVEESAADLVRSVLACRSGDAPRRAECGAAAIETALVVCFVVLPLVFAIIGYAFMLSFRQSVAHAASEGARAAAVAPAWTSQADVNAAAVQAAINGALTNGVSCDLAGGVLRQGAATVGICTMADSTSGSAAFKTIRIDYDYEAHPLVPIPGLGIVMPDRLAYSATSEVTR